ncbi:MAG: DNA polymerase III subunit alpha [Bacillota bacterium]|nr:DNA polymerase III subunit alpha [Bacillota bacterium]
MDFAALHVYSGYSFLKSGLTVDRIIACGRKNDFYGVGLSDFETMSGYPELFHKIGKSNLRPVYGLDVEIEGTLCSLFLDSEVGYRNLIEINLEASKGPVSLKFFLAHQAGVSLILPSEYSRLRQIYKNGEKEAASYLLSLSKDVENFYLGIPYLPNEPEFVSFLRGFVEKYPYQTVAFPHFLYAKKEDAIVLEIVRAIDEDRQLEVKEQTGNNYFLSQDELRGYYTAAEMHESKLFADRSRFQFIQKRGGLLHFPNPLGIPSGEYLRKLAFEGLEKKIPDYDKAYQDRLNYELKVIDEMGYSDYFLIVADYVGYAKTHGISVGPGRGSGAGSLVSYSLDIVSPDPIKHDLMFERFLNPERKSMPDIDVDFSDINRDKVVEYLIEKYGENKVSHIVTMQTIGAKQSLRDIGRVYGYETRVIDFITKTISNPNLSLRDDYRQSKPFRDLVDSDKYYLEIVGLASKIEGLPRHSGLHAAGIVLNDEPLDKAIPVKEEMGVGYVASYEMNYLEEQGFLKMDLLGLRNLTIVDKCLESMKENEGIELDYRDIPYDDKDAIALIRQGKTMGLFQLESPGMRRAIKDIEPESFDDVVALLALFRPGPMENIPSYGRRKKGLEKISYPSPELSGILSPTYGIIVYQEQITQIVRAMTGFSYGQADSFRRAISKKDALQLASLRDSFIAGAIEKGHTRQVAESVYSLIFRFASYGFNKSHAVGYAYLSCQMAYLKAHYPRHFYAAILEYGNNRYFQETITEVKKLGINLALPDINQAGASYRVEGDKLLFPLSGIKGIQNNFVLDLLDERDNHGKFLDIFDFSKRMKPFGLNIQILVRLIDAGCFDSLYPNRASLRASAGSAISYASMFSGSDNQASLLDFDIPKPILVEARGDKMVDLEAEKEALGLMISGSPLSLVGEALKDIDYVPLSELKEAGDRFQTVGAIKNIRTITTKNGKTMAFLGLYDDTGEADFTLWSEVYDECYSFLVKDRVVLVEGRVDQRREDTYIANTISEIKQ